MENRIPQVIHYCWFGGNPLPKSALKCIESWRKFCPGFEIKEWNESNYDVNACAYIREAYEAKKWAFVSDYARFDILYTHGGVYFDTDVELIKPIDDILLKGGYFGAEPGETEEVLVNPGVGMAVANGHRLYKEILEGYRSRHFMNDDGTYDLSTVVAFTTAHLKRYGLTDKKEIQLVEGIWIYPEEYFCPVNYITGRLLLTPNTRSMHHYNSSWLTKEEKAAHRFRVKATELFGATTGRWLERIYSIPYRAKRKITEKGLRGAVKSAIKKTKRHK